MAARWLCSGFKIRVRRRTQPLDLGGSLIEVADDEGVVESGDRRELLSEVEVDLKFGAPRALRGLGLELVKTARLRIGTQSKLDHSYDLACDLPAPPAKAVAPPVPPDCTLGDIVSALLGACQRQLIANQPGAEAPQDPEGVHQARVALRRLRTASAFLKRELAIPAVEAFDVDAKWMARVLGPPRDWDVFVTETPAGPSEALGPERYNRFQLSPSRVVSLSVVYLGGCGAAREARPPDGAVASERLCGRPRWAATSPAIRR